MYARNDGFLFLTIFAPIRNVELDYLIMDKIEEYIVSRAGEVLRGDVKILNRLLGGMSNYTYVIECGGKKYTYRVPGKKAELFVDRDNEYRTIKAVDPLELNNRTVFFDVKSGEKMAEYVDGTILSSVDVVPFAESCAKVLHKLHESCISIDDYDPFGRLDSYEKLCAGYGFVHPDKYLRMRDNVHEVYDRLRPETLVPCHCDFQPSNLVQADDRLYVLDWEYAGMNDPYYDIACHGNVGYRESYALLKAYLGHEPGRDDILRMNNLRAFQCLQWYNVATAKEEIGLGKELKMDFTQIAMFFLSSAEKILSAEDAASGNW